MLERARGGHHDLRGAYGAQSGQRALRRGAPHVPPGHHARDHGLAAQIDTGHPAPDQVDPDGLDRRGGQLGQRLAEVAEVRRHEQRGPRAQGAQPFVGGPDGGQLLRRPVAHQRGLVELHPRDPFRRQRGQQLLVAGQHLVQPVQGRAEQQERHRPHHHGPRLVPQRPRLPHFGQRLGGVQLEHGLRPDLGHDVVVVRVEPLRHPQRRQSVGAPGHREVGVGRVAVAGRHRAEQHRRVQHLVI